MARSLTDYAHVTVGNTRALMSEHSEPLFSGAVTGFEFVQNGWEIWPQNVSFRNRWEISGGGTSLAVTKDIDERVFAAVPSSGSLLVKCTLMANGVATSGGYEVEKRFQIVANPTESAWRNPDQFGWALAELTTEIRQYVEDAAASTGANGISARFLASVLCIEIRNRPKRDRYTEAVNVKERVIERLQMVRRATGGRVNSPPGLAMSFVQQGDASFGVGQTKMSTLAMAIGWIRLIEHERVLGNENRADDIAQALFSLNTDRLWELWRSLAWTKSSIFAAAKVLAFLKNRRNRYPQLSRQDFARNVRAMEIIATEYNLGATNSLEANAGPTWYGEAVAAMVRNVAGAYEPANPYIRRFTNS